MSVLSRQVNRMYVGGLNLVTDENLDLGMPVCAGNRSLRTPVRSIHNIVLLWLTLRTLPMLICAEPMAAGFPSGFRHCIHTP